MKTNYKPVILDLLAEFFKLNLATMIILFLLRLSQLFFLSEMHSLPSDAHWLELRGFFQDFILWQIVSWILFIPFSLLSLIKKWMGSVLYILFFLILSSSEWIFFQYFLYTLRPLDQVVFSYSYKEMMLITGSCININFMTFLPFIILFFLTLFLVFLFKRIKSSKLFTGFFSVISLGSLFFIQIVTPRENKCRNDFEYFLIHNKTAYFLQKCYDYHSNSKEATNFHAIEAASKRYHAAHPEFNFLGNQYPFLHDENTPDVLGSYFNLNEEKPNLVFIIVESLSSCFMGENKIFESYTPFLDSLAAQSLYWKNFLSTADRTFNVLPAMFASLPPGDPTFINSVGKIPCHLSMIRYLRQGGYYTSFFYAGDPSFNYMSDFLQRQETDYILRTFGPKYKKTIVNEGYSWGYSDSDLFKRSFEVLDSLNKSPRLDIYLTLSLHSPFLPPDRDYFIKCMDERISKMSAANKPIQDIVKYKNIFATILYTDHALKGFFENYRKRPDFNNTIFIITGDHGLPELNLSRFSGLELYHVPLIIFSPLLKKSHQFLSVSSHLDITPSFLALMHSRYGVEIPSVSPWLGTGIDTSASSGNTHSLAFIHNNKEILEYVNCSNYFYPGGLLKIQPDLDLKDTVDDVLRQRLSLELEDFKILNTYVTKQNKLIPPEMVFMKMINSVEIKGKDSVFLNPLDSIGEFRSLVHLLEIDSNIKWVQVELTVNVLNSESDFVHPPLLIFELNGKDKKQILWQYIDIPDSLLQESGKGKWYQGVINGKVDISYFNNSGPYFLNLYIWNRGKWKIKFDKPHLKISGYF